jgi:hypothetical protein
MVKPNEKKPNQVVNQNAGEQGHRPHLIFAYFIEATGLLKAFRALIREYQLNDQTISLYTQRYPGSDPDPKDKILRDALDRITDLCWPPPKSTIGSKTDELIRDNSYWRYFGMTIPGKENAADFKAESHNEDFITTFEAIIRQVVNGILDKAVNEGATDPASLSRTLVNLQTGLRDHNNNLMPLVTEYWYGTLQSLLDLLNSPRLMQELNINFNPNNNPIEQPSPEEKALRLKRLGAKVNVVTSPVAEYFFVLADKMRDFLIKVEDTAWDPYKAKELFDDQNFREIIFAWGQATNTDFFTEARTMRLRLPA